MLSIRASRRGKIFWLSGMHLRCAIGVVYFSLGSYMIYSLWGTYFHSLAVVIGIGCVIISIRDLYEARLDFFGGSTCFGLLANSRTLAIVRYRAPTLYIKLSEVDCVDKERHHLVLRGGKRVKVWCHSVHPDYMESDFLHPLYVQLRENRGVWFGGWSESLASNGHDG